MKAARTKDPAYRQFLAALASITQIDEQAFASWLRQNRARVSVGYPGTDIPLAQISQWNEAGVWLRERYVKHQFYGESL